MAYKYKIKEAAPNLAQQGNYKVGDVTYSKDGDTRYTVNAVNPESGKVSWKVTNLPNFDKLFDGALNNTVLTVGGRNLFSFDNFTSFDPEVNAGGQSNLLRGVNFGQVPIPRVYTVTLKTNF